MAATLAAAQERYPQMIAAMEKAKMESVIIQDLVDYGIEQGIERGTRAIRGTLRDMVDASQGRYHPLGMERPTPPLIIEDLVQYGIDLGLRRARRQARKQARQKGFEEGLRQALLDSLDARGFLLDPSSNERIAAEHDPALLRRWCKRAVTAPDLAAIFA